MIVSAISGPESSKYLTVRADSNLATVNLVSITERKCLAKIIYF